MANEKASKAVELYGSGFNCAQAVLTAYAEDMGIDPETTYKMMEGLGGGFGFMQEVCGAYAAACAVISFYASQGSTGPNTKPATAKLIREAADKFKEKWGSIICREVLRGKGPRPLYCGQKVNDAVLIAEEIIERIKAE